MAHTRPPFFLRHPAWMALPYLILPLIIFWRPGLFYIMDDWTALIQMVEHPLAQYLVIPDGEQWFPFFHLVFYGLVRGAGEHYDLLVLINCLGTGVNAWLLYLFFRRHWSAGLAFVLSLLYDVVAVHHAIAWNAFYVGYLMSLGFFLGALLLTDSYRHGPSAARLGGIGLCAGLSILSHNYPLVGLLALPLYVLIMDGVQARRQCWVLTGAVTLVYLVFASGYVMYAGLPAAASHNRGIFAALPGPTYLLHLVYGAFLAPFFYLFWGHYHFPVPAYLAGGALLTLCLLVIWGWGGAPERRLALWALLANALPFVLVSLSRYQRSVNQAFVARYGVFTMIGALILMGTAWRVWSARDWARRWSYGLALLVMGLMLAGQFAALPLWLAKYRNMSGTARSCYTWLTRVPVSTPPISMEEFAIFCPTANPTITPDQARAIQQFLTGEPKS